MPDGSLQNGSLEVALDQEQPKRKRSKNRALGLKITASVLLAMGAFAIGYAAVGFQQGWLTQAWNGLTDAQGAVIGATLTIYAAALAAVLGPLIFTGQIMSVRDASDETLREIGSHVEQLTEKLEYVRKLVRQADELQTDQELNDEKALLTLEGVWQDAAALAVETMRRSRLRRATKAHFAGKWPGAKPYTALLHQRRVINDQEKALFDAIYSTRRYTSETLTPEVLSDAQDKLHQLKESLARRRSKSDVTVT